MTMCCIECEGRRQVATPQMLYKHDREKSNAFKLSVKKG